MVCFDFFSLNRSYFRSFFLRQSIIYLKIINLKMLSEIKEDNKTKEIESNQLINNIHRSSSLVKSNLHASSLTILNYTIGITIMFLPKYMAIAGVGYGSLLLLFFAIMNYFTCFILVYSTRVMNIVSYYGIGDKIFNLKLIPIFTFFYLAVLYGNVLIYQ